MTYAVFLNLLLIERCTFVAWCLGKYVSEFGPLSMTAGKHFQVGS